MGSLRIGPIRFRAISGDHAGEAIPHLHAIIGRGEVMVELLADGDIRLSHAHKAAIRGPVTASELRLVLRIARDFYDELLELWAASQP